MTQSTNSTTAGRVHEIVLDSYAWKKFIQVRSGNPEYIKYFPARPGEGENGEDINSMVILSVLAQDKDGVETWHKVRLYGYLADRFNEELAQKRQVATLSLEGYVKSKVIDDPQNPGTDRTIHYTVVPEWIRDNVTGERRRGVAVHTLAPHQGNVGEDVEDPFSKASARKGEAAQSANMAAAESPQIDERPQPPVEAYENEAVQGEIDEAPF